MRIIIAALAALACAGCATARSDPALGYHLVPGSFVANRGPDGNSVFLDAPDGLILVDSGRHPEHAGRLLAHARERGRPIVALFNTHWHLDHSTGNREIRAAFPQAELYTSNAVHGALAGFLRRNIDDIRRRSAAGDFPEANQAEVRRYLATMDDPAPLIPTRPVTRSERIRVGGRSLQVNLAPFAATEGDVWIYDEAARLAIVGDLVVAEVPFMDTACPEGWRRALDSIAETSFVTLIPGHGDPMNRDQFLAWRTAYGNLLDCAASDQPRDTCIAGWRRDAGRFIGTGRERMIDEYVGYYIDSRLRAEPAERGRYCPSQPATEPA